MRLHPIIQQDVDKILHHLGPQIYKLEGKKVFITGASGMIASYFVHTLIQANKQLFHKPVQLYLAIRHQKKPFGIDKNLHYLSLDISKKIPNNFHYHYIIHAASKAAPKIYTANAIDTLNTNILGLYNLLAITDKNLQSFLFISSAEIYGAPKNSKPISEEYIGTSDHLNTRSCYVEAKRACETICINYFRERKLPVKIARLFHTFGPGLNLNDGRVFSDFINNGLNKKNIHILGDKNVKRPMLYLQDAIIMLFKLLLSSKNGQVYNISNEKNVVTVGKFANMACNIFNKSLATKLKVVEKRSVKNNYYKHAPKTVYPNIYKFKKHFGYTPTTSIKVALAKTIQYYLTLNNHV